MLIAGAAGSMLRLAGVKCPLSFVNARILCVSNFYTNKTQDLAKIFETCLILELKVMSFN